MIKSIKLKNCATYPSTGVSIENCQKINFFYGPNGSGKSTISNFLRNPTDSQYNECEIKWENDIAADVAVYNREFRVKNLKENIAGVFTLGQATIEDIQALEKMKEQRAKQNEDYTTRDNALKKKRQGESEFKASFREVVWERILKPNEVDFQEAFSGFRNNKERFRDEVLRRYKISHTSCEARDSLLLRAKTLFAQKPEKCSVISFSIDDAVDRLAEIEASTIWSKVIVGNKDLPIGRLIDVLDNADWVNQGRKHLREGRICPFCQQPTITEELKSQLDAFFSGEYEQDVNQIKQFISQYSVYTDELLGRINALRTNLGAYPAARIDTNKLNGLIDLLNGYFSKNKAEMLIKEKEPGRIITLTETAVTTSAIAQVDVSKVSSRKVLVLDDPICSLDSTVLYIVSSMVKGLIKDVREGNSDVEQIFILTHNVFFHKETAFIDRRTEVCNDIHFWIISKDNNISSIRAYERNNPIKTSYELLWEELKSNTNASLITTQNIMRRILENYFSILGKAKDDTIVDSFPTIEEKMICRSLLSWINDGSHTIPDDLYIDSYTDSIERYKQIFKEVFIKMGHDAHYKMMMGVT